MRSEMCGFNKITNRVTIQAGRVEDKRTDVKGAKEEKN